MTQGRARRVRLSTTVRGPMLEAARTYARRWDVPLGEILAAALAKFLARRDADDVGPLAAPVRDRRGPPTKAERVQAAVELVRIRAVGGRPLGEHVPVPTKPHPSDREEREQQERQLRGRRRHEQREESE